MRSPAFLLALCCVGWAPGPAHARGSRTARIAAPRPHDPALASILARRSNELGVGLDDFLRSRPSGGAVGQLLDRVLTDPRYARMATSALHRYARQRTPSYGPEN